MATATQPTAPQATDLPLAAAALGVYPTVAAALDAGHRLAARSGGGVPLVAQLGDGSAWLRGIVLDGPPPAPASSPDAPVLDAQGKLIPETAEERAARAEAMRALFATWGKETWDEDQLHRARQAMKALGVPGYEDESLDEDQPQAGES
jgi:hypothetical protein